MSIDSDQKFLNCLPYEDIEVIEYAQELINQRDMYLGYYRGYEKLLLETREILGVPEGQSMLEACRILINMLFQPMGESHHNANRCPYCREYLNGKS